MVGGNGRMCSAVAGVDMSGADAAVIGYETLRDVATQADLELYNFMNFPS